MLSSFVGSAGPRERRLKEDVYKRQVQCCERLGSLAFGKTSPDCPYRHIRRCGNCSYPIAGLFHQMCIRDSLCTHTMSGDFFHFRHTGCVHWLAVRLTQRARNGMFRITFRQCCQLQKIFFVDLIRMPVSYTHLSLAKAIFLKPKWLKKY